MYLAIIILPLLGSIASGFFGRKVGVSGSQLITSTAVVTTTMFAVFSLAFISIFLDWSVAHFSTIVVLTLGTNIYLVFLYNSSNKLFYYNGDILAIFTGYYYYLVEKTIDHSAFNDPFLCINISIGLSMIIIGLLNSKNPISIKDKFFFILENKKKFFLFALAMLFVIFTVNIILFLLGLGITVDTSSLTLFLYTFFPKVISIKIVLTLISCCITKEFKIENVSLSISSVIFMVLLGSISCYYVLPYVKVIMSLALTKLENIVTHIFLLVENTSLKGNHTHSLDEGVYNLFTKLPIIGRFLQPFMTNTNKFNNVYSPFRLSYSGLIKNKINIYPLTKISKFTTIHIATIIENKLELSLFKGNNSERELIFKKFFLYLNKNNLHFAFTKFDYKVESICFLNSKLDIEFSRDIMDLCPKQYKNYLYDSSEDRTRELLRLTDPSQSGYNLQVFMEQGSQDYNYFNIQGGEGYNLQEFTQEESLIFNNLQEGDGSPLQEFTQEESQDYNYFNIQGGESYNLQEFTQEEYQIFDNIQVGESSKVTSDHFAFNREIERSLEPENNDINESTDISTNYSCIEAKVIKFEDKDFLSLRFDWLKLISIRDNYLEDICVLGRTALFEHYNTLIEDSSEVNSIIDNFKLSQVYITEKMDRGYENLLFYLWEYKKDLLESNNIEYENLCPFSNLFLAGTLDYPVDNISEGSDRDYTELVQNDLNLSESQENTNIDLADDDIIIFLKELKTRCINFLKVSQSKSLRSSLFFKDINLIVLKGVIVENTGYRENNFTKFLGELINKKPEIFLNKPGRVVLSKVHIKSLYSKLSGLVRKPLTKDEILLLVKGLENRKANLLEYRRSIGNSVKTCYLRDLNLMGEAFITDTSSDVVECEFLRLLENLRKENPDFFLARNTVKGVDSILHNIRALLR